MPVIVDEPYEKTSLERINGRVLATVPGCVFKEPYPSGSAEKRGESDGFHEEEGQSDIRVRGILAMGEHSI